MIALGIGYELVLRLLHPVDIHFARRCRSRRSDLCVNLASAWLLRESHDHAHDAHSHGHARHDLRITTIDHDDHGDHDHATMVMRTCRAPQDSNYRAAYVHVLADALTSVLTIAGLSAAWAFGLNFMDPLVGLVGMLVILSWAVSLVRSAGGVLLDTVPDPALAQRIRERIETGGDRLADLHLWQLGPGHAAVIVSVVSDAPQAPSAYKQRLEGLAGLSHVTDRSQSVHRTRANSEWRSSE